MSGSERQNRQCSMKLASPKRLASPRSLASLRKCLAKTPKRGLNAKNVPKPRWLSGQTSLNRTQMNGFANVGGSGPARNWGANFSNPRVICVYVTQTPEPFGRSNSSRGLSKDRWSRAQWRASRGCQRTARAPASAPERPTKDRKGTNTASEVGTLPIRPTHVLSFDFKRAL